jgi:hypothetical protein
MRDDLCSCGQPRLPNNPFCAACDLRVLIAMREASPDAADADFEREVPVTNPTPNDRFRSSPPPLSDTEPPAS